MDSNKTYSAKALENALTKKNVSYDKTRISGSSSVTYILHSKGACMPGQPNLFSINSRSKPSGRDLIKENSITRAYGREHDLNYKFSRTKNQQDKNSKEELICYDFAPNDDDAYKIAVQAAYRQVFGNLFLMESERPIELERRLRNGDINMREFVRGIANSDCYRSNYFEKITQQRSIEVNFIHLLGRPPLDQLELINHIDILDKEGFSGHIDHLIDSLEYSNSFGPYTVPYIRSFITRTGGVTKNFINTTILKNNFVSCDIRTSIRSNCDYVKQGRSRLLNQLIKKVEINVNNIKENI